MSLAFRAVSVYHAIHHAQYMRTFMTELHLACSFFKSCLKVWSKIMSLFMVVITCVVSL